MPVYTRSYSPSASMTRCCLTFLRGAPLTQVYSFANSRRLAAEGATIPSDLTQEDF